MASQVEVREIKDDEIEYATEVFFESWFELMNTLGYKRRDLGPKRGFKPTHIASIDNVVAIFVLFSLNSAILAFDENISKSNWANIVEVASSFPLYYQL